jgi:hypothetical protein
VVALEEAYCVGPVERDKALRGIAGKSEGPRSGNLSSGFHPTSRDGGSEVLVDGAKAHGGIVAVGLVARQAVPLTGEKLESEEPR